MRGNVAANVSSAVFSRSHIFGGDAVFAACYVFGLMFFVHAGCYGQVVDLPMNTPWTHGQTRLRRACPW
ncbi:MAG: hypothetical protein JXO22_12385, partial [Phycisphaerae bacterium]|nr:hypothetical protein [Phycisphaerae bacterium]